MLNIYPLIWKILCLGIICSSLNGLFADQFPYKPPQNFILKPQYIALHHPVMTNHAMAQLYFDQGLTFLYAFNHDAAYWSFLRASEVDPEMPMAYWGMALALGTNINMEITLDRSQVAYDAIQRALRLVSKKSERDYIQALARRYSNDPNKDRKRLALDYSQAMRELAHKYPDDVDALTLFAESLLDLNPWNQWTANGKPLEGTVEAVKTLNTVLKKDPNHLGANHYFIHAIEASSHPEYALMSAERLKTLLPSSGHILHMPSHIYFLVGDYQQAARSNEQAIIADREYIREYGTYGIYPVHYLSHNLYLLSRSYTMLGRLEDAKQAANELVDFYGPHFEHMPDLEYYASALLAVLVAFHQWEEILQMPQPSDRMPMTHTFWHFGRAMAFASLGNLLQAREEQRKFLAEQVRLSTEQSFGNNKAGQILEIAEYCLIAKLAEAQGDRVKTLDFLQKAMIAQDSLHYNEPPDWFFSIREALGGLLLRTRKPAEAEVVFREELKKHPRSGRALFGLKESLRTQSKVYDLYWVNEAFEKAWKYSSVSLGINSL